MPSIPRVRAVTTAAVVALTMTLVTETAVRDALAVGARRIEQAVQPASAPASHQARPHPPGTAR